MAALINIGRVLIDKSLRAYQCTDNVTSLIIPHGVRGGGPATQRARLGLKRTSPEREQLHHVTPRPDRLSVTGTAVQRQLIDLSIRNIDKLRKGTAGRDKLSNATGRPGGGGCTDAVVSAAHIMFRR